MEEREPAQVKAQDQCATYGSAKGGERGRDSLQLVLRILFTHHEPNSVDGWDRRGCLRTAPNSPEIIRQREAIHDSIPMHFNWRRSHSSFHCISSFLLIVEYKWLCFLNI